MFFLYFHVTFNIVYISENLFFKIISEQDFKKNPKYMINIERFYFFAIVVWILPLIFNSVEYFFLFIVIIMYYYIDFDY